MKNNVGKASAKNTETSGRQGFSTFPRRLPLPAVSGNGLRAWVDITQACQLVPALPRALRLPLAGNRENYCSVVLAKAGFRNSTLFFLHIFGSLSTVLYYIWKKSVLVG